MKISTIRLLFCSGINNMFFLFQCQQHWLSKLRTAGEAKRVNSITTFPLFFCNFLIILLHFFLGPNVSITKPRLFSETKSLDTDTRIFSVAKFLTQILRPNCTDTENWHNLETVTPWLSAMSTSQFT